MAKKRKIGKIFKKASTKIAAIGKSKDVKNLQKALTKGGQTAGNVVSKLYEDRKERRADKREARLQKALGRQEVRKTAYEHGIDPNDSWSNPLKMAIGTAGAAFGIDRALDSADKGTFDSNEENFHSEIVSTPKQEEKKDIFDTLLGWFGL